MEIINEKEFDKAINSKKTVIVDFSASWCMPCRMLKPILERVEEKLTDVKFYNIDIDDDEEVAKRYRIFSVPTLVAFRSGEKIDSLVGLNSFDDIVDFVERCKATQNND